MNNMFGKSLTCNQVEKVAGFGKSIEMIREKSRLRDGSALEYEFRGCGFESYSGNFQSHKLSQSTSLLEACMS